MEATIESSAVHHDGHSISKEYLRFLPFVVPTNRESRILNWTISSHSLV